MIDAKHLKETKERHGWHSIISPDRLRALICRIFGHKRFKDGYGLVVEIWKTDNHVLRERHNVSIKCWRCREVLWARND